MSPPSLTNSSSSKLNQFGLYRTIDARTEEFLKLSRKRQMRQGCVCAAISTAITVTIVVSILLLYEYHVVGYRVINRHADANYTEGLRKKIAGSETKKLAMLPSLLNVLYKGHQDPKHTTEKYMYKKNWFAEITRKIQASPKGTSPIIFLKAPLGMLDFYSKARETKTKISRMAPKEYHSEGNEEYHSNDKATFPNSLLNVRQALNPVYAIPKTTTKERVDQHKENCSCTKNLEDIINTLLERIKQLLTNKVVCDKPTKMETKRNSCCHKTAIEEDSNIGTTTKYPYGLEPNSTEIITKPISYAILKNDNEDLKKVEDYVELAGTNRTDPNNSTLQGISKQMDLTSKINAKLFDEYVDYITKIHSSKENMAKTAVIPETASTTVASTDIQIETENNNIQTTRNTEDTKYVHIAKIDNPKLKTRTITTTTTIYPFLFTEAIKLPNQSGENYNIFLKVLQEYKDINDQTNALFSKSIDVDAHELPLSPKNDNETFMKLGQDSNRTFNSDSREVKQFNKNNNTPAWGKEKVLKFSDTHYIKLVNGNHNLHSLVKKHNPQYHGIIPNKTNNNIAHTHPTTVQPNLQNSLPSVQVIQIHNNYNEIKRVPYGIHREVVSMAQKPDTIEDLEIDDQMRINDGTDSNEENKAKRQLSQIIRDMSEYKVPNTVSELISGRPSYLEISSRNDWSPHFDDDETLDV